MAAGDSRDFGKLKLPRLIGDGMVLQRNAAVKIWGWARAGEAVTVKFCGRTYGCAAAECDGRWEILLEPMQAGGPYTMDISTKSTGKVGEESGAERIIIKDIMAGDVWVCSGQSNMQTPVLRVIEQFENYVREACCKDIRYFLVPERYDFNKKQNDLEGGRWISPDASNVPDFSAVALFFAYEIYKKYNVPVGIINASIGGTPIEAWMSEESLKDWPRQLDELAKCKDAAYVEGTIKREEAEIARWFGQLDQLDEGFADPENRWNLEVDITDWNSVSLPASWADAGMKDFIGSIWIKKELDIPSEFAGKPAVLKLGTIVDSDVVYLNGVEVGAVTYRYPPRKYNIPAGLIREGKNTITVRTVSNAGDGGFVEDKPYRLELAGLQISLAGEWRYKVGAAMDRPLPGTTFFSYKPAGLYNAMISPLLDFTVKGFAWYQGESNTTAAKEYVSLFRTMITDWRQEWKLGSLPFLFVQLANFMRAVSEPGPSGWAELRDAQFKALSLPDTGMVVAIDAGEWNDIHPLDKRTVAQRLALCAGKAAYGEDIISSGPIYKDVLWEAGKAVISFHEPAGRLVPKGGGPLRQFSIAGSDRKFIWAKAEIKENSVIVWSDDIKEPAAVRYAWADNPEGANLYNEEGLPASPFRTDDWD